MPLRIKYFVVFFSILLCGKLSAQNDSLKVRSYEISDKYFTNYLGFIKPFLAVVPTDGGVFSPNLQLWYLKTQDSILSIEPSYLDSTLLITRTSKIFFEIIKISTDTTKRKITALVLSRGLIFYAVPSNYIKGLNFYVVWYKNKFNICQYYNSKVDTLFNCDKMIDQLEVISNSTILFSYDNKLVIFPLTGKPSVLFDAGEYKISGFTSDNAGGLFVSIGKGIVRINKEKQQSLISTDSVKGKLRYFNKELYVLDAGNKKLFVIHVPSMNTDSNNIQSTVTYTNNSIITTSSVNESPVSEKKYYIIIGSYKTSQEADDAISTMKTTGNITAEVVGQNDAGNWRVSYKSFSTKEEAMKYLPEVKQFNPSAWILSK